MPRLFSADSQAAFTIRQKTGEIVDMITVGMLANVPGVDSPGQQLHPLATGHRKYWLQACNMV